MVRGPEGLVHQNTSATGESPNAHMPTHCWICAWQNPPLLHHLGQRQLAMSHYPSADILRCFAAYLSEVVVSIPLPYIGQTSHAPLQYGGKNSHVRNHHPVSVVIRTYLPASGSICSDRFCASYILFLVYVCHSIRFPSNLSTSLYAV